MVGGPRQVGKTTVVRQALKAADVPSHYYWRDRGREVDFVVERGGRRTAIEVKSGRRRHGLPGMDAFEKAHGPVRKLLVGGDGTPLEAMLAGAVSTCSPEPIRGNGV